MRLKRRSLLLLVLFVVIQFLAQAVLIYKPTYALDMPGRNNLYRYVIDKNKFQLIIRAWDQDADTPRKILARWNLDGSKNNKQVFEPVYYNEAALDPNNRGDTSGVSKASDLYSIAVSPTRPGQGFLVDASRNVGAEGVKITIGDTKVREEFFKCSSDIACITRIAPSTRDDAMNLPTGDDGSSPADDEPGNSEAEQDSCDVQVNNPLSWIICPILQVAEGAVNMFATRANDALCFEIAKNTNTVNDCEEINPDSASDKDPPPKDSETPLYKAWGNVRNIANVMFVIALLVIVISQLIVGKM